MGKGEAWVNGQSIGRYWISFLTPAGTPTQIWAQGLDFFQMINIKRKMERVITTGHVLNVEMSTSLLEQFAI
ncbi:unnamed protein product [Camellia sinensis]